MSTTNEIGNEGSVREQTNERVEADIERVDGSSELWPSVEQEIQGRIDTGARTGLTLAEEERVVAREWEVRRTRLRYDRRSGSNREARSRQVVSKVSEGRRYEFGKRAASVDSWLDPDEVDPREQLSSEDLGVVNREAARMAGRLSGWSRAAISRRLAERVVDGASTMSAVVGVFEEFQQAPGQVVPIGVVEDVRRREVSVKGKVTRLFEPSHPRIDWVGILEDESGTIKLTAWKRSNQPRVREGDEIRVWHAARNFYQGRASIAATGWTRITHVDASRREW